MVIKYLTEGIFKTPQEAKAARERAQQKSNADKVAEQATKIIIQKIEQFIDECLLSDNKAFDDDNRSFLPRTISGRRYDFLMANYYTVGQSSRIATYKSSVNWPKDSNTLYVDIYVKMVNEEWFKNHTKINREKANLAADVAKQAGRVDIRKFDGTFDIPHYNPSNNRYIATDIRDAFSNTMDKYIISTFCNSNTPKEFAPIKDIMTSKHVVLNKIHMFADVPDDITFGGELISRWCASDDLVEHELDFIRRQLNAICELISFENKGNVIFRDFANRIDDIII